MKIKDTKKSFEISVIIIILILLAATVFSGPTPEGPTDITVVNSSSRTPAVSQTLDAIAGNVTQVDIFAYTQTQTWQAYYGNVSGKITLDDSYDHTIYEWDLADPSGQIYASTADIDFSDGNIECYNFSKSGGAYLDLQAYETSLGLSEVSADGVNETFNETTNYDPFYVSSTYINNTCPTVYLFNYTNESSEDTHQEVMLYELTQNNVIYTAIIRQGGILGFNNEQWDFQMIVGENGHAGNEEVTEYNFYVALE